MKIFDKLLLPEIKLYGIEIVNHDETIVLVEAYKKNNQIHQLKSFEIGCLNSMDTTKLTNKAVSMVINNNQIISKEALMSSKDFDETSIINQAFPQLNINDFYYNILTQKSQAFISICRKDYLNNMVAQFDGAKIGIKSIFLGNLPISFILTNQESELLFTSNARIECKNSQILKMTWSTETNIIEQKISGLSISNKQLLPFSAVVATLKPHTGFSQNLQSLYSQSYKQFQQEHLTKSILKFGLSVIFVVLLVNFLVFNSYFNKYNQLAEKKIIYNNTINQIESLQKKITQSEKLVSKLAIVNQPKNAFYLNRIIEITPNDLLLHSLIYQPISKKIKDEKEIELTTNVINLQGITKNHVSFLNWVDKIDAFSWVEKCEVKNYQFKENQSSEFTLQINIIENTK